jgi:hypothetical protein
MFSAINHFPAGRQITNRETMPMAAAIALPAEKIVESDNPATSFSGPVPNAATPKPS